MSNDCLRWAWLVPIHGVNKNVLVALADHADNEAQCYPSVARLVLFTGWKERAVRIALRELEQAGLIRTSVSRGRTTNSYVLSMDPACHAALDQPEEQINPAPHAVNGKSNPASHAPQPGISYRNPASHTPNPARHTVNPAPHAPEPPEPPKEPPKEPPPNPGARPDRSFLELVPPSKPAKQVTPVPKPAKDDDAELAAFWAVYPRKREGIGGARKAFAAARRKATFELIMIGLERYEFDDRESGRFLPMAATWLNQERWNGQSNTQPIRAGPKPVSMAATARALMAMDDDDEPPPPHFDIELDSEDFRET